MKSTRLLIASFAMLAAASQALAQSPSAIYTWDNTGNATPNVESWVKNFGTNTALIDNSIPGSLRIIETGGAGADIAITDGANRVRESATAAGGGTDVTGLDYLEFDIGHTGVNPIAVQFFVQASTGFTFVALGPDVMVAPGMNTYQVPLTGLTPNQAVYLRTMGFNARNHAAEGDVVWTLNEVRAGGTPLNNRVLFKADPAVEGGLQGAYANFDLAAIQGNDTGQNQSGLSYDAATGSLMWTDLGGQQGAAVNFGNGTAWNGNTFNNRTSDVSNYTTVSVRVSATDPNDGGGTLDINSFMQTNNFSFQSLEGGATRSMPIDGRFHTLVWDVAIAGNLPVPHANAMDAFGLNLLAHDQNLDIRVDWIRFNVPEPATASLLAMAAVACGAFGRRRRM